MALLRQPEASRARVQESSCVWVCECVLGSPRFIVALLVSSTFEHPTVGECLHLGRCHPGVRHVRRRHLANAVLVGGANGDLYLLEFIDGRSYK